MPQGGDRVHSHRPPGRNVAGGQRYPGEQRGLVCASEPVEAAAPGHQILEAARLVGSFVFGVVGTHRLEARVSVSNGRGNGALRKLGAVQEGVLRRSLRRGGEYLDQSLWSVLQEDWGTHWVATGPRVH